MLQVTGVQIAPQPEQEQEQEQEQEASQRRATPDVAALVREETLDPIREMRRLSTRDGWFAPALVLGGAALAASVVVLEAMLFPSLLYVARYLDLLEQRLVLMVLMVGFAALVVVVEAQLSGASLRIGRRLDMRLRLSILRKLAVLPDHYFRTRLVSDMAERSHSAAALRSWPPTIARLLRVGLQIAVTIVAMAWVDPHTLPWAAAVGCLSMALPLLANRVAKERDLRVQTHAGALSRFYLDALIGQMPIRAHSAERAIRRVHEELLTEWARASYALQRIAVAAEGMTALFGFALVGGMLFDHVQRMGVGGDVLLLAYWALSLPALGNEFAVLARHLPFLQNLALRSLEPLAAPEEPPPAREEPELARAPGVALHLEAVSVQTGRNVILDAVDLDITPGSHVAIVGASGAGKSSLLGMLLGFQRVASGRASCDGEALTPERIARLRREVAWLDPAITLWNRPLLDNVCYSATDLEPERIAQILEQAELRDVIEELPDGLLTPLGEAGGLISGGEGQRVRLARAFARRHARLVLLDEPFRGLDRQRRQRFLAQARLQWRDATLLCVTHDMTEAASFPRVLVMEGGRVIEDGAPAELSKRASTRYARMLAADASLHVRLASDPSWRGLELRKGAVESLGSPEP